MKSLVCLFALLLPAAAMANPGDDPAWSRPSAPYHVIGNIYNVGTEGVAIYLIDTGKGLILLDSGPENTQAIVEGNIRTLGFRLKDVKYIIETHAHYDHVGSMAAMKNDTGAIFIASRADHWALENGRRDGDNIYGPGPFPPVKVDRVIADGAKLMLGNSVLTAHLTPGHTRGDTSWTMTVRDKGRPLKVLFFGSTTTAGNVLVGNKVYPGIVKDYRATFAKLEKIHPDVFLANHPVFANMAGKRKAQIAGNPDAFIDRDGFPAFLAQSENDFEAELKKEGGQ